MSKGYSPLPVKHTVGILLYKNMLYNRTFFLCWYICHSVIGADNSISIPSHQRFQHYANAPSLSPFNYKKYANSLTNSISTVYLFCLSQRILFPLSCDLQIKLCAVQTFNWFSSFNFPLLLSTHQFANFPSGFTFCFLLDSYFTQKLSRSNFE